MSLFRRKRPRSKIECRYLQYRLENGQTILLPLIQVELVSEKERLTTIGLVDSGANVSFIPYEIADILELIPEEVAERDLVKVFTAGGRADFFRVRLKRLSLLYKGTIFSDFNNFTVLVPFNPERTSPLQRDLPYVVLGRDSIFRRFIVIFREKQRKFELIHHKWEEKVGI